MAFATSNIPYLAESVARTELQSRPLCPSRDPVLHSKKASHAMNIKRRIKQCWRHRCRIQLRCDAQPEKFLVYNVVFHLRAGRGQSRSKVLCRMIVSDRSARSYVPLFKGLEAKIYNSVLVTLRFRRIKGIDIVVVGWGEKRSTNRRM